MKILETNRLLLRHLEPDDLHSLFALYADPDVRRYIPDAPQTLAEAKEELDWFSHGHPRYPKLGLWATIYKPTNQFIGRCGLLPWTIDGQDEVEVAYTIAKTHWGQGLGTEAAQAILDYGVGKLGLPRLICLIDYDNVASIRVAEKIGMIFEKEGQDEMGPFLLYARNRPALPKGDFDAHSNQLP
jgi:RimJ/RimL family protein N-acetyltransferase